MSFIDCIKNRNSILMEGALGERLKREYQLVLDENVTMAGLVYSENGKKALRELWSEYAAIAGSYQLPFLATTPTRRVNQERIERSGYNSTIIWENVKCRRNCWHGISNRKIQASLHHQFYNKKRWVRR